MEILVYQYWWASKQKIEILPRLEIEIPSEPKVEIPPIQKLNLTTTKLAIIYEGCEVNYILFDSYGKKVAYLAKKGGKEFVVINDSVLIVNI